MKSKFAPLLIGLALIVVSGIVVFGSNSALMGLDATGAGSALDVAIAQGEKNIESNPPSAAPYVELASLYLQKSRETADGAYYSKVDALMDRATLLAPNDGDILALRASAAIGRHQFKEGYDFATEALALNKNRALYYGLLGDAALELGKYEEAIGAYQKMTDLRPDFSSWSRIAYVRELYGDIAGAKDALKQAISSGSSYKENIAWAYVELGKLHMRDNLTEADAAFRTALELKPGYTPALEGHGKVAYAGGDTAGALGYFAAAYKALPLAHYAIAIGDIHGLQNEPQKASQQYALAHVAFAASAQSGINTDLEESLFLSDHDLNVDQALRKAQNAYALRPSIFAADALAWALYKNGNFAEAERLSKEALRLGEHDPLILFHAGMIALKNDKKSEAKKFLTKANANNPHFSLQYAPLLQSTLKSLQ